jgi:UPF0755 protein
VKSRSRTVWASALALVGVVLLIAYGLLFAPANYSSTQEVFVVKPGLSVGGIATSLHDAKFARSSLGMKIAMLVSGATTVKAGSYNLSPRMSSWKIAAALKSGDLLGGRVTIPEGYTIMQMAVLLDTKNIVAKDKFVALSGDYRLSLDKLGAVWQGSLEGYLFPDTYLFNPGDTPESIIGQILANFERRVLPFKSQIAGSGYSLHEVLTIASMVEKEAKTDVDRKLIAGVLLNRLKENMRLDVDATVRYAVGKGAEALIAADLASSSPYNTRKVMGLPPGPICNPGLDAIEAVLSPTKSDYLYYLTDTNGKTYYAKTLAEHNINKAKYLK